MTIETRATAQDPFNNIPDHLVRGEILPYLGLQDLLRATYLSRRWNRLSSKESLWKPLFARFCFQWQEWAQNELGFDAPMKKRCIFLHQKEVHFRASDEKTLATQHTLGIYEDHFRGVFRSKYILQEQPDETVGIYPIDQPSNILKELPSNGTLIDPYIHKKKFFESRSHKSGHLLIEAMSLYDPLQAENSVELEMPKADIVNATDRYTTFSSYFLSYRRMSYPGFKQMRKERLNHIWNIKTGKLLGSYLGEILELESLHAEQKDLFLLYEGKVNQVSLHPNSCWTAKPLLSHTSPIREAVSYQKWILSLHEDGYLRLWDYHTKSLLKNLRQLDSTKYRLLSNASHPLLQPISKENTKLEILDLHSGACIKSFPFHLQHRINDKLSIYKDGLFTFQVSSSEIYLLDTNSLQANLLQIECSFHSSDEKQIFLARLGQNTIIASPEYGKVTVLDKTTGKALRKFRTPLDTYDVMSIHVVQDKIVFSGYMFDK